MNTNTDMMTEVSNNEIEQLDGGAFCHVMFVGLGAIAGGLGGGPIGAGAGALWGDIVSEALCD